MFMRLEDHEVLKVTKIMLPVKCLLNLSVFRRCQLLGLPMNSTWGILKKMFGLHPYKIVLSRELKLFDSRKHRDFVDLVVG